jgi:hypothetical protein
MIASRFREALQTLSDHQVEFIIVGGVAAVLEGVPVNTFDVDVVHRTSPENVARLLVALRELDACYRFKPEVRPNESHLSTKGHSLLKTRFGSVDVLGSIGKSDRTYDELLPHSHMVPLSESLRVRVLDLETQIAIKEEVADQKDLAMLPILRATLAEIRRRGGK